MKKLPRISDAEWRVMKVLWAESPKTADEVVDALTPVTIWKPKTIKTLINRLLNKKAIGYEKKGRAYHYYPLVDETECAKSVTRSFLQRVYGRALKPMVANFIEDEKLSRDEIEELKRILDSGSG